MGNRTKILILLFVTLAVFIGTFLFPRFPQDPGYHAFADTRSFGGIPNFLNVVSNILFLIFGTWGLLSMGRTSSAFRDSMERCPYSVFFLGFALTCLGSAYYHLWPGNSTLLWDRLAMAVVCAGILAATMGDRIGGRTGAWGLLPLLAFGVFSVLYWYIGELHGQGDVRFYAIEQFYSIAAVVLIMILFPARHTHSGWLAAGAVTYGIAKVLEALDKPIFDITRISGHTLKHVVAAFSALCVLEMLKRRKPVTKQN